MLTQISVAEPALAKETSEISTKLQQLRRLRAAAEEQPISAHLQSALQVVKGEPANATPEVSYIFIGITVPSSN